MAIKRIRNRPKGKLSAEQKAAFVLLMFLGVGGVYFGFRSFGANLMRPIQEQFVTLYETEPFLTSSELESKELEASKTKDTDGDGLVDYDELYIYRTSPYLQDSDSDGYTDEQEVLSGNDPNCPKGRDCGVVTTSAEEANTENNALQGLIEVSEEYEALMEAGEIDVNDPNIITTLFQEFSIIEIRKALVEAGVPEDQLADIDDETLRELFSETLVEVSAEESADIKNTSEEE